MTECPFVTTCISYYTLMAKVKISNSVEQRIFHEKLTGPQLVKKSPHFMEPEGSLPHSQQPATCPARSLKSMPPHPNPLTFPVPRQLLVSNQTISPRLRPCKIFSNILNFLRVVRILVQPQSWRTTLRQMSSTTYSVHSQLPSISGGRSSNRNVRMRHAVVTDNRLSNNSAINTNSIEKLCLIRQMTCKYLLTKVAEG